MKERIDLISLNPSGTYEIARSYLKDKHVDCPRLRRICSVHRSAVFEGSFPLQFKTLEILKTTPLPKPPLGSGKRFLLVHANDLTPITWQQDVVDNKVVQQEARVLKAVARQEAHEGEARSAVHRETQAQVMVFLAVGSALLMAVVGVVAAIQLLR